MLKYNKRVYSHQLHVALVDELLLELCELLAGGGVRVHILRGDVADPAQPRPVGDVDVLRTQSYTYINTYSYSFGRLLVSWVPSRSSQ